MLQELSPDSKQGERLQYLQRTSSSNRVTRLSTSLGFTGKTPQTGDQTGNRLWEHVEQNTKSFWTECRRFPVEKIGNKNSQRLNFRCQLIVNFKTNSDKFLRAVKQRFHLFKIWIWRIVNYVAEKLCLATCELQGELNRWSHSTWAISIKYYSQHTGFYKPRSRSFNLNINIKCSYSSLFFSCHIVLNTFLYYFHTIFGFYAP